MTATCHQAARICVLSPKSQQEAFLKNNGRRDNSSRDNKVVTSSRRLVKIPEISPFQQTALSCDIISGIENFNVFSSMSSSNPEEVLRELEAAKPDDDWEWMVNQGPEYLANALPTQRDKQDFIDHITKAYKLDPPAATTAQGWLDMVLNTNFKSGNEDGDLVEL
ncbi:hypothetical protein CC86DRAFT_384210 [Ophiobolus disseminans]|uniref:Uncharacterized protein n=1 Tax=Ophiobolus disseminans TaxID=1469910 RepID=A0A6A6ZTI7_9PLEO|nr:hypothetical protein CC86DRAFT_384210 [Ophiobolus disseminans]